MTLLRTILLAWTPGLIVFACLFGASWLSAHGQAPHLYKSAAAMFQHPAAWSTFNEERSTMITVRENVSGVQPGSVYGGIEVLGNPFSAGRHNGGRRLYLAVCRCNKCGEIKTFRVANLSRGNSRGCKDCFDAEQLRSGGHARFREGVKRSPLYTRWLSFRQRCNNPRNEDFAAYGGRGIRVCEEWNSYEVFRQWAMASGYQDGLEIDRKDNDGNYEPSNCHWTTRSGNNRNKRNNFMVTAFGQTKCLGDWMDDPRCRVDKWTIAYGRLRSGWDAERALTTEPKNAVA